MLPSVHQSVSAAGIILPAAFSPPLAVPLVIVAVAGLLIGWGNARWSSGAPPKRPPCALLYSHIFISRPAL
jgi:hypothetical protein